MEELPLTPVDCLNCGTTMEDLYCPRCGQKRVSSPLRVSEWAGEGFESLSTLDAKLPRTVIDLTRGPGKMVRRFVAGHRIPYTGPFRYAFLTSALWVVAFTLFNDQQGEVESIFAEYGQLVNLLAIPFLALVVHLSFWGKRFTFAEHLCFLLFVTGHVFLWRAGIILIDQIPGTDPVVLVAVDGILFLVFFVWSLWQLHRPETGRIALSARILAALICVQLVSNVINRVVFPTTDGSTSPDATTPAGTEVGTETVEEPLPLVEEGK